MYHYQCMNKDCKYYLCVFVLQFQLKQNEMECEFCYYEMKIPTKEYLEHFRMV